MGLGTAGQVAGDAARASAVSLRAGEARFPHLAVDLRAFVGDLTGASPGPGSGGFQLPEPADLERMGDAWKAIRRGDLTRAAALTDPVGYEVSHLEDTTTGRMYVMLRERAPATPTVEATPRGWGTYLLRPEGRPVMVELPHPWDDAFTDSIGVQLVRRTDAEFLALAGASRDALPGRASDAAHVDGTVFETIHRSHLDPGSTVVQVHGFNELRHPGYGEAVVSEGVPPTNIGYRMDAALKNLGWDSRLYDGTNYARLGATRNTQGKSARAAGAQFVHVEIDRATRERPERRERLANAMASALG